MKRRFIASVAVLLAILAFSTSDLMAAVLNGFNMQSQGNDALKVVLNLDERVAYEGLEQNGQYMLLLKNTQISSDWKKRGFPTVLDDKNRFMARALPAGQGQVKILFPTLSAQQVSVSVLQNTKTIASKPRLTKAKPVNDSSKLLLARKSSLKALRPSETSALEHQKTVSLLDESPTTKESFVEKEAKPLLSSRTAQPVKSSPKRTASDQGLAADSGDSKLELKDLKIRVPQKEEGFRFEQLIADLLPKQQLPERKQYMAQAPRVTPWTALKARPPQLGQALQPLGIDWENARSRPALTNAKARTLRFPKVMNSSVNEEAPIYVPSVLAPLSAKAEPSLDWNFLFSTDWMSQEILADWQDLQKSSPVQAAWPWIVMAAIIGAMAVGLFVWLIPQVLAQKPDDDLLEEEQQAEKDIEQASAMFERYALRPSLRSGTGTAQVKFQLPQESASLHKPGQGAERYLLQKPDSVEAALQRGLASRKRLSGRQRLNKMSIA